MNVDTKSLQARVTKGKDMVCAVSRGDQRWSMTAPADPGDPDLVISDALKAGEEAIALLTDMKAGYSSMSVMLHPTPEQEAAIGEIDFTRLEQGARIQLPPGFMTTWPATSDIVLPRDQAGRKPDPVAFMLGLAGEPHKLSGVATLLRDSGAVDIPRRYEAEMAAALHWLVGLAIRHGDDWGDPYKAELARMRAKIAEMEKDDR
jgi:hypothetical protein